MLASESSEPNSHARRWLIATSHSTIMMEGLTPWNVPIGDQREALYTTDQPIK
jgi:hypothetical protein